MLEEIYLLLLLSGDDFSRRHLQPNAQHDNYLFVFDKFNEIGENFLINKYRYLIIIIE